MLKKRLTIVLALALFIFNNVWAQKSQIWYVSSSGTNGNGSIYKSDGDGNNLSEPIIFTSNSLDGGLNPVGALVQSMEEPTKLYGAATNGGEGDYGVIYSVDILTNRKKVEKLFGQTIDGTNPIGGLTNGGDGILYGITKSGGSYNTGVIFEYNIKTSLYRVLYNFNHNGQVSKLYRNSNGKLYGLSSSNLYEFDPGNLRLTQKQYIVASPYLTEDNEGNFYGYVSKSTGQIFKYNPNTNSITYLLTFSGDVGTYVNGAPVLARDGALYGMTKVGGEYDWGTVYKHVPNGETTKMADNQGPGSFGIPIQSVSGLIIGTGIGQWDAYSSDRVAYTISTYNPETNTYLRKIFDTENISANLDKGGMLEIALPENTSSILACGSYTSPSGNHTWTENGIYHDIAVDNTGASVLHTIKLELDKYAGDINCDGKYTHPEKAGDIDKNGEIDNGEIAGDINGDGIINNGELIGDVNGGETISPGEIHGDENGDGLLNFSEVEGVIRAPNVYSFNGIKKENNILYTTDISEHTTSSTVSLSVELSSLLPDINLGDVELSLSFDRGGVQYFDTLTVKGSSLVNKGFYFSKVYNTIDSEDLLEVTIDMISETGYKKRIYDYKEEIVNIDNGEKTITSLVEQEKANKLFTCYPNPFINRIHVDKQDLIQTDILVGLYSISGNLISKKILHHNDDIIFDNLDDLQPGVFIIKVEYNNVRYGYKMIKK